MIVPVPCLSAVQVFAHGTGARTHPGAVMSSPGRDGVLLEGPRRRDWLLPAIPARSYRGCEAPGAAAVPQRLL